MFSARSSSTSPRVAFQTSLTRRKKFFAPGVVLIGLDVLVAQIRDAGLALQYDADPLVRAELAARLAAGCAYKLLW